MTPQYPLPIPNGPMLPPDQQQVVKIPEYDILIVDGSYLIHRILYASGSKGDPPFSEMYNSRGEPTGAVYGCLKTIRSIINLDDFIARDIAIVWDGRPKMLSPRRVAMYPGYKVHDDSGKTQTEAAESAIHRNLLETQRPKLGECLNLLGVPSVNIPCREGDDVIGAFVRMLPAHVRVLVVSDDKDYYQLVAPTTHVYRAGIKDPVVVNHLNFEEKVKVKTPAQYLLSAAICGDGSDAITGISGVADTTAQRVANNTVINGMASFAEIKKAIDGLIVSDKRNQKRYLTLLENLGIVARNLQLMDLRLENLTDTEKNMLRSEVNRPRGVQEMPLIREFDRLEFRSYLTDMSNWLQPFRRLTRHADVLQVPF